MSGIVTNFTSKIADFGYAIGFFSEFILLVLVVLWLVLKSIDPGMDIVVYVMGLIVSGGINTLLKRWIGQPRPQNPRKFLYSEHFDRRQRTYGMPSGHSQNVVYSIAYLYGSVPDPGPWVGLGCAVVAMATWIERWQFHNHTISQLAVGAVVGVALAYFVIRLRDFVRNQSLNGHHHSPTNKYE
jgi:membrane-associated phospholipid phosphatase